MISIIVVTYNRKALLEKCIKSLMAQDYLGEYEIIIIDNGSTDETHFFLKRSHYFRRRIKFIANAGEAGLSVCKNIGIKESSADIIAFIDDDCVASPCWLSSIEFSLKKYDAIGGPVVADKVINFPSWWKNSLNWTAGLSCETKKFIPLGSNMAAKKEVLERIGGYDVRINRTSNNLVFGEDNEIITRLLNKGYKVSRNDKMTVHHYLPKERIKLSYLLWRSYMEGKSLVIREHNVETFVRRCCALIVNPFRFLLLLDVNCLFRMIVSIGYIYGYWHRRAFAGQPAMRE